MSLPSFGVNKISKEETSVKQAVSRGVVSQKMELFLV
jgi:hypothetical protein